MINNFYPSISISSSLCQANEGDLGEVYIKATIVPLKLHSHEGSICILRLLFGMYLPQHRKPLPKSAFNA